MLSVTSTIYVTISLINTENYLHYRKLISERVYQKQMNPKPKAISMISMEIELKVKILTNECLSNDVQHLCSTCY